MRTLSQTFCIFMGVLFVVATMGACGSGSNVSTEGRNAEAEVPIASGSNTGGEGGSSSLPTPTPTPTPGTGSFNVGDFVTTIFTLNIRSQPMKSASIVDVIYGDTMVLISNIVNNGSDTWYEISDGVITGFTLEENLKTRVAPPYTKKIHIYPGTNVFSTAVESLQPGDELIVHEGTYLDTDRISINVVGTASKPVLVRKAFGEDRPVIKRPVSSSHQNIINIEGARHLRIEGLEIEGNGNPGDGIKMNDASYITIFDNIIHHVDIGIKVGVDNTGTTHNQLTLRRNHIYDTGLFGPGEGMYLGCNYGTCKMANSLVEGNYIHHTNQGSQGDGIELKQGSYNTIIRDNVVHDNKYPSILVYGTSGNPRNTVEGNIVWNSADAGLQAAADALIQNNIILDWFISHKHQATSSSNLTITNNLIWVTSGSCMSINDWSAGSQNTFVNNYVSCINSSVGISGWGSALVDENIVYPSSLQNNIPNSILGNQASTEMQNPSAGNFAPKASSSFWNQGLGIWEPVTDFYGEVRTGGPVVGPVIWPESGNMPLGPLDLLQNPDFKRVSSVGR